MMHRSKKPLRSEVREYFNQKRPVNMRVDGTDGNPGLGPAESPVISTGLLGSSVENPQQPFANDSV